MYAIRSYYDQRYWFHMYFPEYAIFFRNGHRLTSGRRCHCLPGLSALVLLAWEQHQPEPQVLVAVARVGEVAVSRPAEPGRGGERTATDHSACAQTFKYLIKIGSPLPYITMHVIQPVCIGRNNFV